MFSAVHPIFTARRQWERIGWMGGPHEDGSREVYCYFQIERIDSKERLRHLEHEIFSVLKCVFTAVEDFQDMLRTVREQKGPRSAAAATTTPTRRPRASSSTGCSTTTTSSRAP